jgi:hypothetical protein
MVFPVGSVHHEDQRDRPVSLGSWDGGVRRGWRLTTARLLGHKPWSRGTSTVWRHYPEAQWKLWLGTLMCVVVMCRACKSVSLL